MRTGLVLKVALALFIYVVLFSVGSAVFVPRSVVDAQAPEDAASALGAMVVIAALDTAILAALAIRSRLRGMPLWLVLSVFFYFVKTVTSQLEALYFMPNVMTSMAPWLFAMTLPLAVLFPPVLMWAVDRWKLAPGRAWQSPTMSTQSLAIRLSLIGAVVYPLLFFGAGYFIAWQSPEVREFYTGSTASVRAWEHFSTLFAKDPMVLPFEMLRGVLWGVAALVVLRTSIGPWWTSTLMVALAFCFIQNDVHLISNPLMPATVRLVHFVETGSSNLVFAFITGWLLTRRFPSLEAPGLSASGHLAGANHR